MTRPLSVKSLHLPPRMAPGVGIVAAFTSKSSYNPIIKFKRIIQSSKICEAVGVESPTRRGGARHTSGSWPCPPAHASSPRKATLLGTLLARKALHLGLRPGHRSKAATTGRPRQPAAAAAAAETANAPCLASSQPGF
jgi:hypothetical protein